MSAPSIILFDGHCVLCNRWVDFVIRRDPQKKFRFGALQTEKSRQMCSSLGMTDPLPDSIILIEGERIYLKSTAALRIIRQLQSPLRIIYIFILIPSFLRDGIYSLLARFRYQLFGKKPECRVPTGEKIDLFI